MFKKNFVKLFEILLKFTTGIINAIGQRLKGMMDVLNSLYKKVLSAILCSAFGVTLVLNFFISCIYVIVNNNEVLSFFYKIKYSVLIFLNHN